MKRNREGIFGPRMGDLSPPESWEQCYKDSGDTVYVLLAIGRSWRQPPKWAIAACRELNRDYEFPSKNVNPIDDRLLDRATRIWSILQMVPSKSKKGYTLHAALKIVVAEQFGELREDKLKKILEHAEDAFEEILEHAMDCRSDEPRSRSELLEAYNRRWETFEANLSGLLKRISVLDDDPNVDRLRKRWDKEFKKAGYHDPETGEKLHPRQERRMHRVGRHLFDPKPPKNSKEVK